MNIDMTNRRNGGDPARVAWTAYTDDEGRRAYGPEGYRRYCAYCISCDPTFVDGERIGSDCVVRFFALDPTKGRHDETVRFRLPRSEDELASQLTYLASVGKPMQRGTAAQIASQVHLAQCAPGSIPRTWTAPYYRTPQGEHVGLRGARRIGRERVVATGTLRCRHVVPFGVEEVSYPKPVQFK